ncbi:hypothetical protein VM1G_11343 [Cytospora mali]|uniref:Uncharacterized protein n=1 Tax=Cytospora mali TaxID=578113 RepID=A0A194VLX5_CYTMA|nr:hypothetical protein VM1G_11343 [Valsa mali]
MDLPFGASEDPAVPRGSFLDWAAGGEGDDDDDDDDDEEEGLLRSAVVVLRGRDVRMSWTLEVRGDE